jgi:hypothetical protein
MCVASCERNMNSIKSESKKFLVEVYLDDGRVFEYYVNSEEKVREHASAIIATGYRHNNNEIFEHYPPHRILKVKCSDFINTKYIDKVRGT